MEKKQIKNLIHLDENELYSLYREVSTDDYVFIEKSILRHGGGFYIDEVVFKEDDSYYRFLAINYLDEQMTYTTPFEVFPKKDTIVRTTYSTWVDSE